MEPVAILRIAVGAVILLYVGYCLLNQKVWVRGDVGLKSTVLHGEIEKTINSYSCFTL